MNLQFELCAECCKFITVAFMLGLSTLKKNGGVYGYHKINEDLYGIGKKCGKNRVVRLMKEAKLKAQAGY